MNLTNKHVVITGGSKGIGAELARQLKEQGAKITIVARASEEFDTTVAETGALAITADLSDSAQLNGMIDRIEAQNGAIDVLVNNAGVGATRHYATLSAEDVNRVVNTNLLAPMELTRQVLPTMLRRDSGAILNVSSVTGEFAVPGCTAYATTKAGLSMFTQTVQRDIRASNVNISVVVLGAVPDTQIYDEGIKSDVVKKLAEQLSKVSSLTPQKVAQDMIKLLQADKRGAIAMPFSSAPAMWIRLLPLKFGDLIFCRGKPPHDPVLDELLKNK